ncbi:MAG: tRNA (adenosine(37)-N6)-dimethylallyltransferase MiaA, partial [Planctomycetes bacterium]|nr:tRNA (adenosine(37)-N6)-dimethylallyltransferase MiaA [Planctomycetota bacterium]
AGLLAEHPPLATTPRQAVGYAEIIAHLAGELSLAEAVERIKINTRQFAKAQRTWSKRFRAARWLEVAADESPDSVADRIFEEL